MLKYFDQGGNFVRMISEIEYENLQITRTLSDGDKTLSFSYLGKYTDLSLEGYIETDADRYVIKEIMPKSGSADYKCQLDVEPLEASTIRQFTAKDKTIQLAANAALVGTGWTCSVDSGIATKVRSVQQFNKTPFELLLKIRDAFMCEIRFDSKAKVVSYKEQYGSDRGVYLRPELNLVDVSLTLDSYDFYTRIIPVGEDGLTIESVNQGKNYVENYQYSTKIRTLYWEDTNYTDAQALKDDAIGKLADLSRPKRSYSASVRDLAKLSADYGILDYDIGDTVTITDEPSGIRDKQRIVSITEYPEDPERNTVELSNTVLTWEEYQSRLEAAANAWEEVSNSDGSINGVYVHGVQAGDVVKVQVDVNGQTVERNLNQAVGIVQSDINSVNLRVGTVETTYLQATMANIDTANINTAKIKDLFVQVGFIRDAVIDGARITGYLDAVSVNAASITAGTLVADRIAIRGSNTALVYALNNYGQIVSSEVNTLDGYIVTPRTIEADKIVAHSITATEITTQNLVGTNGWINLSSGTFAYGVDKLTWDGTTLGVKGAIIADTGNIGGFIVSNAANTGTSAEGGHIYARSLYTHSADDDYEYETGMKGSSGPGTLAYYVRRITKGAAWSSSSVVFSVTHGGSLTATAGKIGPWSISTTSIYKTSATWGSSTAGAAYFGDNGISITDKFKVDAAGALTASGVSISGTLTAGANSKIGPWTVTASSIYYGNSAYGNASGLYFGTSGLSLTDKFKVSSAGALTATSATITGKITVSTGSIGGFEVVNTSNTGKTSAGGHCYGIGMYSQASDSTYEYEIGMKGDSGSPGYLAFYVGRIAKGAAWSTNTKVFSVANNGALTATSGKIGPWYIHSGGLSASSSSLTNTSVLTTDNLTIYSTSTMSDLSSSRLKINGNNGSIEYGYAGVTLTNTAGNLYLYPFRMVVEGGHCEQSVLFGNGTGSSNNTGIYNQTSARWIIAYNASTGKTAIPDFNSSDIRLKTDIKPTKVNALDVINKIQMVEFKKDGVYQPIGVIADWLQEIDPQLAYGGGYDGNGDMDIKCVDIFYLEGYLIKAIQELSDQLDQLRRTASWKS